MTVKRFWCLDEYKGETSPIVDGKFAPTNKWLCNKLNELHEENQALSSQVMLYKSELDVFANQNKKLERQIKEQFDLLIKARKQGFIDF